MIRLRARQTGPGANDGNVGRSRRRLIAFEASYCLTYGLLKCGWRSRAFDQPAAAFRLKRLPQWQRRSDRKR